MARMDPKRRGDAVLTRYLVIRDLIRTGTQLKPHPWWWPFKWAWFTMKGPFQKQATIYYPPSVPRPEARWQIIAHELVHVRQFKRWGWLSMAALQIFPLPILFSGRWFIERDAYIVSILLKQQTIESAVNTLWWKYGWCWPRPLMRRWFEAEIGGEMIR